MIFGPSTRTKVGVTLLLVISLLSSRRLLRQTGRVGPGLRGKDAVTVYDREFDALRKLLPARGTVGYLADAQSPDADDEEVRRYYLAQYALSPVILVRDARPELVIGNFRDPIRNCKICKDRDYVLLQAISKPSVRRS